MILLRLIIIFNISMRNIIVYILSAFIIFSCSNDKINNDFAANAHSEISIEGMTCEINCARKIKAELMGMEGVEKVKVNLERKLASIDFDKNAVTNTQFIDRIESINNNQYKAELISETSIEVKNSEQKSTDISPNVSEKNFELPNIIEFFTNLI